VADDDDDHVSRRTIVGTVSLHGMSHSTGGSSLPPGCTEDERSSVVPHAMRYARKIPNTNPTATRSAKDDTCTYTAVIKVAN
jgi:hypothetical protein